MMLIKGKRFYLLVLFFFFSFFLFPFHGLAQEKNELSKETVSAESSKVNYQLPYPGILPDHPFYKLKVLRDKIIGRLIVDQVKKIEYNLFMADKTINASKLLAEKGNMVLAKETALKGEHYFTLLVTEYKWAYWKHENIPKSLDEKIKLANKKHQEVFKNIMNRVNGEDKKVFQMVIDYSKRSNKELTDFKIAPKKTQEKT